MQGGLRTSHPAMALEPISVLLGAEVADAAEGQEIITIADRLAAAGCSIPVFVAPQDEVSRLAGYRLHHGALALGRRRPEATLDQLLSADPPPHVIVCLERIVHTDNVGSIFRTMASLASSPAILLSSDSSDPLLRKCIRVSSGRVFASSWGRAGATTWLHDLRTLRDASYVLVAAEHAPRSMSPAQLRAALPADTRVAIIIGSEGDGLQQETLALCDHVVEIPMRPTSGLIAGNDHPSLNAAVAAAMMAGAIGPQ